MTANDYPLSQKEFKNWLEQKEPNKCVGRRLISKNCPIFRYLKNKQIEVDEVTNFYTFFEEGYVRIDNPKWVEKFTTIVDNQKSVPSISAGEALKLLIEVIGN